MVNRGYVSTSRHVFLLKLPSDALHHDEWRGLPLEQQMGFKIPIELMINITHLRRAHAVVTTAEYLRLHGQNPLTEASDGRWTRNVYHIRPNLVTGQIPSLAVIKNAGYDPQGVVRVDRILEDDAAEQNSSLADPRVVEALFSALPDGKHVLDWKKTKRALRVFNISGELEMERVVAENGWRVLYTYDSVCVCWFFVLLHQLISLDRAGLEYNKAVVHPVKMIAPGSTLRGFATDYGHIRTNVLLLEGAVHYGRKPVCDADSIQYSC